MVGKRDQEGRAHRQLVYYDPKERAFNDTIQRSPLPVKNYFGIVRVTEDGDGRAELSWQGVYDANGVSEEQATEILGGFYASIVDKFGESFARVE